MGYCILVDRDFQEMQNPRQFSNMTGRLTPNLMSRDGVSLTEDSRSFLPPESCVVWNEPSESGLLTNI